MAKVKVDDRVVIEQDDKKEVVWDFYYNLYFETVGP